MSLRMPCLEQVQAVFDSSHLSLHSLYCNHCLVNTRKQVYHLFSIWLHDGIQGGNTCSPVVGCSGQELGYRFRDEGDRRWDIGCSGYEECVSVCCVGMSSVNVVCVNLHRALKRHNSCCFHGNARVGLGCNPTLTTLTTPKLCVTCYSDLNKYIIHYTNFESIYDV